MMNIIEIFPKICKFFPNLTKAFLYFGLGIVHLYHGFCGVSLINTAFEDAQGIEAVANFFLIPSHYLCEGKTVSFDGEHFIIKQRFQYETRKRVHSPFALTFFVPGLALGSACKTLALCDAKVREKHAALKAYLASTIVMPQLEIYRSLGIDVADWRSGERCIPQGYPRRPGDENNLAVDKGALKEIVKLFTENQIPFWIDCGTCIGAYRHGGVIPWDYDLDLSILVHDFQNARNVLKKLDPKKYVAQDWSGRGNPQTYIRVYLKENHNHIDIYTNAIDPINQTITYIVSQIDSNFMAEGWKDRERRQTKPIPFDVIFPLKKGVFDGIEVPVPNQTTRFLQYKYGPNLNPPCVYSEETGQYEKDLSHPYWKDVSE